MMKHCTHRMSGVVLATGTERDTRDNTGGHHTGRHAVAATAVPPPPIHTVKTIPTMYCDMVFILNAGDPLTL